MKKTLIVNLPMQLKDGKMVYESESSSLTPSKMPLLFAILAYLEPRLTKNDSLKCIFIAKKEKTTPLDEIIQKFKDELEEINHFSIPVEYVVIESEFEEKGSIHNQLFKDIINNIEDNATILADVTFGPKDVPIIEFSALRFALDFLNCEIERIIYSQGTFENGKLVSKNLCDLMDLFTLQSLTSTFRTVSPEKARDLVNRIIDL